MHLNKITLPNHLSLLVILLASFVGLVVAQWSLLGLLLIGALLLLFVVSVKIDAIVYLFLFSSIFFKYRLELGPVSLDPYRVLFLLSVAALPLLPIRHTHLLRQRLSRTAVVVLALLLLFISGWYRSPTSFRSVAIVNTLLLVSWLAFLLFLTYFVDRRERFQNIIKVYLGTSTALALYGLFQTFTWIITGRLPQLPFSEFTVDSIPTFVRLGSITLPRIESLFHDANLLAVYLVIAIIIVYSYLLHDHTSPSRRLLLGMLLLIHIAAIILTISRSGILLLLFSTLVLSLKRSTYDVLKVVLFLLLVGLTILILQALVPPISLGVLGDYYQAFLGRLSLEGEVRRLEYAQAALRLFRNSPLIGVGMGHPALRGIARTEFADTAHSFYLTILSHYGIIGFSVVAFLLWSLIYRSVKVLLKRHPAPLDLSLATAVWVLLLFQITYDNLFGELTLFPFAVLYIWSSNYGRFGETGVDGKFG